MSKPLRSRQLHRRLGPWLLLPLLLIALSGLTYRIGRSWFGFSSELGDRIMWIHTGGWFGGHGSMLYLLVVGGGLLFFIFSGLRMALRSKPSGASFRRSHRLLAMICFLPLLVSAVTGIAYHAGDVWFATSPEIQKILMSLHQGSWLGKQLRVFYILLPGLGLIALGLTGLRMWFADRTRKE